MHWWAWVAVGTILLGSELAFVDAQFYLVFVGSAALIVGGLGWAGLSPAVWVQWSLFMTLAAVSMVFFRRRIYERLRRNLPVMKQGLVGEMVILPAALPPGETIRVEHRGSSWSVINAGRSVIPAGTHARIERIEGLTLVVKE